METVIEALQFASSTHRSNLENLLKETPEAVVEGVVEEPEVSDAEVVEDESETPSED